MLKQEKAMIALDSKSEIYIGSKFVNNVEITAQEAAYIVLQ